MQDNYICGKKSFNEVVKNMTQYINRLIMTLQN